MTPQSPKSWACAFALLCIPALATAARGALDCAHATTQADMNQCANQDYQRADQKLNQLYQQLLAKTEPGKQDSVRDVQRAWVKYRDLQCAYEAIGYAGGSIAPLVRADCLTELTGQRNQTLERLLHGGNPN